MILDIILLLVGFVILIRGADIFVNGSSNVAKRLNVSPLIIGLTIVALGTSAPEAAVSISAGIAGSNEIAVSNIVGSNMLNLLLIVGVCAIIKNLKVDEIIIKREFPLSLLSTFVLWFMISNVIDVEGSNGIITRSEGLILLSFFGIFAYANLMSALKDKKKLTEKEKEENKKISLLKNIILLLAGLALVVFGGDMVVDNASSIAIAIGISETLVGLTIVSIGTSLPELVTSIVATTKGENDIAIGNVIGSNIFNILFILGTSALVTPLVVNAQLIKYTVILIAISIIGYIFAITGKKIGRKEGICMVIMFIMYLLLTLFDEGIFV